MGYCCAGRWRDNCWANGAVWFKGHQGAWHSRSHGANTYQSKQNKTIYYFFKTHIIGNCNRYRRPFWRRRPHYSYRRGIRLNPWATIKNNGERTQSDPGGRGNSWHVGRIWYTDSGRIISHRTAFV